MRQILLGVLVLMLALAAYVGLAMLGFYGDERGVGEPTAAAASPFVGRRARRASAFR